MPDLDQTSREENEEEQKTEEGQPEEREDIELSVPQFQGEQLQEEDLEPEDLNSETAHVKEVIKKLKKIKVKVNAVLRSGEFIHYPHSIQQSYHAKIKTHLDYVMQAFLLEYNIIEQKYGNKKTTDEKVYRTLLSLEKEVKKDLLNQAPTFKTFNPKLFAEKQAIQDVLNFFFPPFSFKLSKGVSKELWEEGEKAGQHGIGGFILGGLAGLALYSAVHIFLEAQMVAFGFGLLAGLLCSMASILLFIVTCQCLYKSYSIYSIYLDSRNKYAERHRELQIKTEQGLKKYLEDKKKYLEYLNYKKNQIVPELPLKESETGQQLIDPLLSVYTLVYDHGRIEQYFLQRYEEILKKIDYFFNSNDKDQAVEFLRSLEVEGVINLVDQFLEERTQSFQCQEPMDNGVGEQIIVS